MIDISSLCDQVLKLLDEKKKDNYRICVFLVGPPGSGKSTIARKLCVEINKEYNEYLKCNPNVHLNLVKHEKIDLTSNIRPISAGLLETLEKNNGICGDLVEDTKFEPVKQIFDGEITEVIGRGGRPNSFTVVNSQLEQNYKPINIAQIVPMDGFHLSRRCLDFFNDPKWAHNRRGSPMTFDSNNFLQLCKVLRETSQVKPKEYDTDNCFQFLSESFIENFPEIKIPSFDHSLKDPTPNDYSINGFTRILVFEGLYLLYNQENWAYVYSEMIKTNALLIWNVDIEEGVIQERVGKRHLQSGIVKTLDDGIKRFQMNDLLNARLIKQNSIKNNLIINIRND